MSKEIGELILEKFVNEEIMTKSELDRRLDVVMDKYTRHMDAKFSMIGDKFTHMQKDIDNIKTDINTSKTNEINRFRVILGAIGVAVAILGFIIKLH
jgi:hypothetical protein